MERAARDMLQAPYYVFAGLVFDSESAAAHTAQDGFPKVVAEAKSLLDEAMKLSPDKAAEIGKFRDRFQKLVDQAKLTLRIASESPGMEHGSSLKAEDLDAMADGLMSRPLGVGVRRNP